MKPPLPLLVSHCRKAEIESFSMYSLQGAKKHTILHALLPVLKTIESRVVRPNFAQLD